MPISTHLAIEHGDRYQHAGKEKTHGRDLGPWATKGNRKRVHAGCAIKSAIGNGIGKVDRHRQRNAAQQHSAESVHWAPRDHGHPQRQQGERDGEWEKAEGRSLELQIVAPSAGDAEQDHDKRQEPEAGEHAEDERGDGPHHGDDDRGPRRQEPERNGPPAVTSSIEVLIRPLVECADGELDEQHDGRDPRHPPIIDP